MPYYQLVFNKPIASFYTYEHDEILPSRIRVKASFGTRIYPALVVSESKSEDVQELLKKGIAIKRIARVIDEDPILTEEQYKLALWMSEYYFASLGECLFTMIPSARREKEHEFSQTMLSYFAQEAVTLNAEQEYCVNAIVGDGSNIITRGKTSTRAGKQKKHIFYLYGSTGSGKTEIFLQAAQKVVRTDKQLIYLVPEISLVYQIYPVLCKRFGANTVAVLHSALKPTQRLREWNRIMNGEVKVIVGVRSAIFAPVHNLALIIIDEEHDVAYKSDMTPRYHVRHIAMKRSLTMDARLVMGSATPSLESWNYMHSESCTTLCLARRVSGGYKPHVDLVALQNVSGIFSPTLQQHMNETLEQGFQVLLLINKRGFSRLFLCVHCGHTISCPQCSVPLVLHKKNEANILQCHHCGYNCVAPTTCPDCGYTCLSIRGWGTQRVQAEVQRLFPQWVVDRFDSDVALDRKNAQHVMKSFYTAKTSILVGTQIIAKGINIPRLQLVGVLSADNVFSLPDFRASERAMSLLMQVAGRAGRFFKGGKVIIQTYMKEHPILQAMLHDGQETFYENELQRRKAFALPPFTRIVRLVFRGKKQEQVMQCAETLSQHLNDYMRNNALYSTCSVLGPAECALAKVAGNHRFHVLLSAEKQSILMQLLRDIFAQENIVTRWRAKGVYVVIDPDAQSMM